MRAGKPTSWGQWAPQVLNVDRGWSDERGVNALQVRTWARAGGACATYNFSQYCNTHPKILSWVLSAYNVTGSAMFSAAYDLLTNSTNQYDLNMVCCVGGWVGGWVSVCGGRVRVC
jgi:hypothetical protein